MQMPDWRCVSTMGAFSNQPTERITVNTLKLTLGRWTFGIAILVLLSWFLAPFAIVPAGMRGVMTTMEAEQKVASAKAEAESLRLQRQEVTPDVLALRTIEKWDGHLPQVTGGVVPLMDFTKVAKK
jgi:hypothetical protein